MLNSIIFVLFYSSYLILHNAISTSLVRANYNDGRDIAVDNVHTNISTLPSTLDIRVRIYRYAIDPEHDEFPIDDAVKMLMYSPHFYRSQPTVLIIHGMSMKADSRLIQGIVDAFGTSKKYFDYNILTMDFPNLFRNDMDDNNYFLGVVANAEAVGRRIHEFLRDMIRNGLTHTSRIYLVSNGIGAHVCGYAARPFGTRHPVEFIAGLNPPGIGDKDVFFGGIPLSQVDARVVHIYHPNSYGQSTTDHLGTANFIFNGRTLQPDIWTGFYGYGHARAVWLFVEAINKEQAFVARKCPTVTEFFDCLCNENESVRITFPPDDSASGKYYLRTNDNSPYGMGEWGSECGIVVGSRV